MKHFSGTKLDDIKHCIKPTPKKYTGTNDLVTNKNFNKIANAIVQLAKSAKTDENRAAILSLVPGKDKFNAKTKKVNILLKRKM